MAARVAVLTNIPAPYRLSLFQLMGRKHDLEVVFDAPTEPNRSWDVPADLGFPHTYTKGLTVTYRRRRSDLDLDDVRYLQLPYGLLPTLRRIRPDVIVSLEMGVRTLQASLYARWAQIPLILWWEGTPHTEGWVSKKKQWLRRYLVRRSSRFWANGKESAQLLQSYGARADLIDPGMIGIDTGRLGEAVSRKLDERAGIRQALGLSGVVFLFVGQLVARKGVAEFLAALDLARTRIDVPFSVLWVGDGPERRLLESWAARHPDVTMRIEGFKQPDEVATFYAAADVFVLPTLDDNWSLVALEAAVAGLPQVFSTYNGVTHDLLSLHASGHTVDPRNAAEFAAALCRYVTDVPARLDASTSARISSVYSPAACSQRASDSIEAALGAWRGGTRPSRTRTRAIDEAYSSERRREPAG